MRGNPYLSPLRYPGGKRVIAPKMKHIVRHMNSSDVQYFEPFAGGSAVALHLLISEVVSEIHINDYDKAIFAFWKAIIDNTDEFCSMIKKTPVTIDEWHRQKHVQDNSDNYSLFELGFSTFFLNRTNRSGILRGGVIGGKNQNSKYKIDCRFTKRTLIQRILKIAKYSDRIKIYNLDASYFINYHIALFPLNTFVFLDPPYYNKGYLLYENHYTHEDHLHLANTIRNSLKNKYWITTYDNTPEISKIYSDFKQTTYSLSYSTGKKAIGSEIMIYSPLLQNTL